MFARRREQLCAAMSDNSVAIFASSPEQQRSRDTEHLYRQDSDFFYFCGFNEPQALLLLIKQAGQLRTVLFNRTKDQLAEIWHGRRLGQAAALEQLGVDHALSYDDLKGELHLQLNGVSKVYLALGRYPDIDQTVFAAVERLRNGLRHAWKAPSVFEDWRPIVDEMRLFKSPDEVVLLRKAAQISAAAHIKAMQACQPGVYEYQLEAEIHHQFGLQGARSPAYGTIVGGGDNACILHYTENDSPLKDGDLVLIDAGAEYQGYAGDITRTFPVNGRFSKAQAELYQVVLTAQEAALSLFKPGATIKQINHAVLKIMVGGLVDLGIMQGDVDALIEADAYKDYYMHGLGHWLGLDVHDVGDYQDVQRSRPLEEGMVLTVEPGLYIASDAEVPEPYRGLGIRIEDDIVITAKGCDNLSIDAPKSIADIEALMVKA